MKNIFYLLFLFCCIRLNAQVLTITFSGDSVKDCQIAGISSVNGTLDYIGRVTYIEIKESPAVTTKKDGKTVFVPVSHQVTINGGNPIKFLRKDGTTKNSINCGEINSMPLASEITLREGEIISCYRGSKVVGTIVIKEKELSAYDIVKKISCTKIHFDKQICNFKDRISVFSKDTLASFKYKLNGCEKIKIENVRLQYSDKEIPIELSEKKELSFEINPAYLLKDTIYNVTLLYDVVDHKDLANKSILIFKIKSPFEHRGYSTWEIVIGITVLLIVILLLLRVCLRFYIKRKFKQAKCYVDNNTQKKYKICCIDEPQIGDLSNHSGECKTVDGYIYRFERRKRWSLFPELFFIGRKIECKNDTAFIYNMENANELSPCIKIDLDGNPFSICKGASVEGKGTYEIEDYVIKIEALKINSISKSIKDIKTTKTYRVVLTNDTPQKNDEVIPPIQTNSKKFYQFESREGVIYEVRNNRIDNIRISSPQQSQNVLTLFSIDNKKITVITQGEKPSINDIASPDGNYQLNDGTIVKVKENRVISVENKITEPDVDPTDLLKELQTAREQIESLSKRPTSEQYTEIVNKLSEANEKLKDTDKAINDAVIKARADEKHKVESAYKKKINEEYILISTYKREKTNLEKQKEEAIKAMNKAEEKVKTKEGEIKSAKERIVKLDEEKKTQAENIIRLNASLAKMKEAAQKKNAHYLIQIQETLTDITELFKNVYKDLDNSTIKEGLITPLTKGVSGLSAGILSWSEDFSVRVLGDSESFFGADYLTIPESEVKELLAKKFISNIVKSDSFSKFVRLYQLSTVPFIREQLIDAKMDIDTLNKLYYKVYSLITDFGYTIICPRLFEEQHSDSKYQWFNATNLFNIIKLSEEEKSHIKALGSETIIDVNQIGYESPWVSRKATAVTPDF